jgi:lipid A 3-O-deacylase
VLVTRGRAGRRAVFLALGAMTLIATTARAQSIQAGTVELTLAGGFGESLSRNDPTVKNVTSFHLLPHLGYYVTDEIGGLRALRGNLEILIEPTVTYLDGTSSATVAGAAVLPRWVFAASPPVRPYVETGGGVVGGQVDLRQTDCDVNFIFEAGAGVMMRVGEHVALTAGLRYHHLSNANRCNENAGINSVLAIIGISYFLW